MTHTLTLDRWLPARLNALLRMHWAARKRHQCASDTLVACTALAQRVPRATSRRRVSVLFRQPRGPLADPDARLKQLLDALVHAGLLRDDRPEWCELGSITSERGPMTTVVTLEDVEG